MERTVMYRPRASKEPSTMHRDSPAWPRVAALAVLAMAAAVVVLLPHHADAVGTGFLIAADPPTDRILAPNGGLDTEILRLAASSDSNNIYFWLQVGDGGTCYSASTMMYDPTVAGCHPVIIRYPIDFVEAHNVQMYAMTYYTVAGGWSNNLMWHGTSEAGGTLGTAITSTWVCNELKYTIPRGAFDVPPLNGDPWTNIMGTAYNGVGGTTWDTADAGASGTPPGIGTWTVGVNGPMWPDPPTIDSVTANGDNTVRIAWTPAPANNAQPVTKFIVYRSTDGGATYTAIHTTADATEVFYDDDDAGTGLVTGTTYTYAVTSVNCPQLDIQPGAVGGGESLQGTAVDITPDFRPGTPTGFSVGSATTTSLTLTWTQPDDCPAASGCTPVGSGASGVQGFAIYRGPSGAETFLQTVDLTGCSMLACAFVDDTPALASDTQYCYYIVAYDGYLGAVPPGPPLPNLSPATGESCRKTLKPGEVEPSACTLQAFFQVPSGATEKGDPVTFSDLSTDTMATKNGWTWDLGDGFTSNFESLTHTYYSSGNYVVRLTVTDSGGCVDVFEQTVSVSAPGSTTPPNTSEGGDPSGYIPPVVNAGEDQTTREGSPVKLGATASGSSSGFLWSWRQVSGPSVNLQKVDGAEPEFTAPAVTKPGEATRLIFAVHVSDGTSNSEDDFVLVTVVSKNQRPPVANAGRDPTVQRGDRVTLDAVLSSDPDGDSLSFAWTHVGGAQVPELPGNGRTITLTTPVSTTETFIDVQLTVSDGGYVSADTVRIWLKAPPAPIIAFKATPQKDGTVTFAASGVSAEYRWDFGDNQTKVSDQPVVSHTYAAAGTYTVTLRLGDAGEPYQQSVTPVVPHTGGGNAAKPTGGLDWMLGAGIAAVAAALVAGGILVWALRHRPE
ncbi:MAG: PKD domain-containing protein [bacterium]